MDGYDRFIQIQSLVDNQVRINNAIFNILKEMDTLPKLPSNIDTWISSISDEFKLSDFSKMFKINKEMMSLIEEKEINAQKLKVAIIDNLIEKINKVIEQ
jgi:hypothetical protein